MTAWANYPTNFTITHSSLYWVESLLVAASLAGLVSESLRLLRKRKQLKTSLTPSCENSLKPMSAAPAWKSRMSSTRWELWLLRYSGLFRRLTFRSGPTGRIWTAEEEAANMRRLLEENSGYAMNKRLHSLEEDEKKRMKGITRVFATLSLIFITSVAVSGYIRPFWYPIEHRENVYVLDKTPGMERSWDIWTQQYGRERFDCCPDFPCDRVIWAGWIADDVRYQERGNCKSIRAEGLGWWWHRNGPARRIQ